MKIFLFSLLMLPLSLVAQDNFSITGRIAGLTEGSVVTITDVNTPTDTLARASVIGGGFELNGAVKEPSLVHMNFDGVQRKAIFFIGNEKIQLEGKIDSVLDVRLTGSRVHDDFELFRKTFDPLFQDLYQLGQRLNSSGANDTLMRKYEQLLQQVRTEVNQFVRQYPASPVTPFVILVTKDADQEPGSLEKKYALLDKKVQEGYYGNIIRQQIENSKIGEIGTQAIDFSQADTEGRMVSLSDFRGKYVLVDFWASWCRPCRVENPNLVKAYQKFKDKNFTVLGVSLDRDRDDWLEAIKADKLTWTQLSDLKFWNNEVATKYKVQSIPQNFLVDPAGKIVAKNLRGAELEQTLSTILK